MTDRYAPDPQFVASLEWQLASEGRRRVRFPEEKRRAPRASWPLLAALVLAGLVAGAGGVLAAEKAQLGARRLALLSRTDILLETAQRRLELTAESLVESERAVAAGFVSDGEAAEARARFDECESEFARLRLDRDEIVAAGAAPRSDLGAPTVGGRDFVSERLAIDLAAAEKKRDRAGAAASRAVQLVEVGVMTDDEAHSRSAEAVAAEAGVGEIGERIDLRARFLAGELTASDADQAGLLASARARLAGATIRAEAAAARLARTKTLAEGGFVSGAEVRAVEEEAARVDTERRLEALEVEVLERRIPRVK